MSEASVKRIAAEFLQQVDVACAEGRAEEIFTAFHRAIGCNFAETVFLSVSSKRNRATAKSARWFSRWIESFAYQMSLELVEGVRKSFLSSGYALGPVSSRCEAAAVAGFTTRFYSLLGVSPEGGST